MTMYLLVCAALFGAVIGSFLNVVILRTMKSERLTGRSKCASCSKVLHWYELLPVVSYLIQRGRCRGCRASISLQYPLVEGMTALVFCLITLGVMSLPLISAVVAFALFAVLWAFLVVIFVFDLYTTIIPNTFVYPFIVLSALVPFVSFVPLSPTLPTLFDVLAGPVLFLPFFILWYVSRGTWMGLGDGKLAWGIGWMLGLTQGFSALMLGFMIGALVSVFGILLSHLLPKMGTTALKLRSYTITMKSEVPLAPFLIVGVALVFFFGIDLFSLFEKGASAVLLALL